MRIISPMRLCPQCNAQYEDGVRNCPNDGRRVLPEAVVRDAGGDPLLGATLAERYTIIGKVGAGGMGTVYRAEQAPISREVALKVLRRDLGRDPETAARFHREARTLSQLKHPHTVHIIDFGQTPEGLLFLAMELLEGEMLSARLKRQGPLDVPLAIRIASGVLRSLAEAHSRGIIHRDLKPDNIFLAKVHGRPDEDEIVKVVDFGIAKIRDGDRSIDSLETQEGTVFGTPRYMSPEQAQGKTLDGRSDLYAVGVLLFHMLTGQPPFTDDDAVVVMAHHIKTVPKPVRTVAPGRPIPAALEALVRRAVEKDPGKRPQTAEVFLAELEACIDEARALAAARSTTTTPTPPPISAIHTTPPSSRRTLVIAAALAAILLGSASAVLISRQTAGRATVAATTGSAQGTTAPSSSPPSSSSNSASPTVATVAPTASVDPSALALASAQPAGPTDVGASATGVPSADPGVSDASAPIEASADPTQPDERDPGATGPEGSAGPRRRRSHSNRRGNQQGNVSNGSLPSAMPSSATPPAGTPHSGQPYHRWQD